MCLQLLQRRVAVATSAPQSACSRDSHTENASLMMKSGGITALSCATPASFAVGHPFFAGCSLLTLMELHALRHFTHLVSPMHVPSISASFASAAPQTRTAPFDLTHPSWRTTSPSREEDVCLSDALLEGGKGSPTVVHVSSPLLSLPLTLQFTDFLRSRAPAVAVNAEMVSAVMLSACVEAFFLSRGESTEASSGSTRTLQRL